MKNRGVASLITSLTLCLLLFGAGGYGMVVAGDEGRKALDKAIGEVRLSLMVTDSLSEQNRVELERLAGDNEEVKRTTFVSKEEARAEFERAIGHPIKMGIELPASIEVFYVGGSAVTARLLSRFTKCQGVRDVVCDPSIAARRDSLENSLVSIVTILTIFVALVVLVLLYFVVAAWVRRAAGGTRAIIEQSLNAGAIAGVGSGVLLILIDQYIGAQLSGAALGVGTTTLVASMMVVGGVVISILFTYMSIKTIQR